ncbi:hypothetical protein FF1_009272 [Malus domestica]
MNEAITKLTRTVEEKDLQIAALVDPMVNPLQKEVGVEEEPLAKKVEEKPKPDQAMAFMGSLSIQQLYEMIASTIKA